MPHHEPPPDDYESITELIMNLDLNDEGKEEEEDLPPYQIVKVDIEGNTAPFLDLRGIWNNYRFLYSETRTCFL